MSSYICDAKHFNSIEKNLQDNFKWNDRFNGIYRIKEIYPDLYEPKKQLDEIIDQIIRSIIDDLRKLNVVCHCLQYKESYGGDIDHNIKVQEDIAFIRKRGYKKLSLHGLYNAMLCLHYQIELEHLEALTNRDESKQKPYQFLESMIDFLAYLIVSKLPEDKTNRWSIE